MINNNIIKTIIFVLAILLPVPVFSNVKVFLHAKAIVQDDELYVKDIAFIEGIGDKYDNIRNLRIDVNLYRDHYIDRKEIYRFIKNNSNQKCLVYGNAVRIFMDNKELSGDSNLKDQVIYFVRKGDTVSIIMKRKSILIEMLGVSKVNARVGERVTVELKNGKVLKGVLTKNKIVEVIL